MLVRELDSAQRTLVRFSGKLSELFPLIDIENENWSNL